MRIVCALCARCVYIRAICVYVCGNRWYLYFVCSCVECTVSVSVQHAAASFPSSHSWQGQPKKRVGKKARGPDKSREKHQLDNELQQIDTVRSKRCNTQKQKMRKKD